MKNIIFYIILPLLLHIQLFAQTTNWAEVYGGAGGAELLFLANTNQGIIAAGNYLQDFPLDNSTMQSQGGSDIFILWIDSTGNTYNSLFLGSSNNDYIRGLDTDSLGNIYIAGEFKGILQLGNFTLQSFTQSNFLAKIDHTGQTLWLEQIYGTGTNRVLDLQLNVDQSHIIISGYFNDSLEIQGQNLYDASVSNIFVIKTTITGNLEWMQKAPKSVEAKAWSIAALPNGKIWVAIEFRDSITMPQDSFFIHPTYTDILLAKLDSNGQWLDSKRWGGVYNDRPKRIRLSPNHQNLWMAGEFVGILNLDNNIQLITAFKYYDIFWVKMDLDGISLSAGQSNTIANTYLYDMSISPNATWLSGYFQDSLRGANEIHQTLGGFDAYWFKIDSGTLNLQNSNTAEGLGNDLANAILAKENTIILGGTFQQDLQIANENLNALGFSDAWLAWLDLSSTASPIQPFIVPQLLTVKIVPNPSTDSFTIILENLIPLKWELYALSGQPVARGTTNKVNVQQLPSGTYSLTVYTDEGMGVAKIIKK